MKIKKKLNCIIQSGKVNLNYKTAKKKKVTFGSHRFTP